MTTLGQVYDEIERAYKDAYEELKGFMHLDEVHSFLRRRKYDLETFKEITSRYSQSADIVDVHHSLREIGAAPKYFGGICMKKSAYFKVTDDVQKAIKDELEERSAFGEKPVVNYNNADYAIPDELTQQELLELFES